MSYSDIIRFWFPNHQYQGFWFDGSKDYDIEMNFLETLKMAERGELDHWISEPNKYAKLALLILLDQFSRNIYRTSDFRINDPKAFEIARSIVDANEDINYPVNMRIFILMPYRHQHTTPLLNFVMTRLSEYDTTYFSDNDSSILEHFKMATLKDYSKVTDTIITHSSVIIDHPPFDPSILDDVCETFHIVPTKEIVDVNSIPLYKSIKKYIDQHKIKIVGISLSGGIDSMVMTYLFYQMRLRKDIDDIICVHLNWSNRTVSDAECDYIIRWCQYLNITCLTRKVEHMTRNAGIDRIFYEDETRKIRFAMYKYAVDRFGVFGFCLGHHKDDLAENVFMNIMRGNDLFDLFVMSPLATRDGINILRPMLDHHKKDIYEVSNMYGICYMKDTTPHSSFRGTIRTQIFPAIDAFDPALQANLIMAGKRSDEWNTVIELLAIKPILSSLNKGTCGFSINATGDMLALPESYWIRLFLRVFHNLGINMMTHKNVSYICTWFRTQVLRGKITFCCLSNGYFCAVHNDKLYFISRQLQTIKEKFISDQIIDISKGDTIVRLDRWTITISKTDEDIRNNITHDDIIRGHYIYTEPIDDAPLIMSYELQKKDHTKKIFRGLGTMSKYLPKVTSGNRDFVPSGYVKIDVKFS